MVYPRASQKEWPHGFSRQKTPLADSLGLMVLAVLMVLADRRPPWQRRHFQGVFQEVCRIGAFSGGEGSMFPAEGTGRTEI